MMKKNQISVEIFFRLATLPSLSDWKKELLLVERESSHLLENLWWRRPTDGNSNQPMLLCRTILMIVCNFRILWMESFRFDLSECQEFSHKNTMATCYQHRAPLDDESFCLNHFSFFSVCEINNVLECLFPTILIQMSSPEFKFKW